MHARVHWLLLLLHIHAFYKNTSYLHGQTVYYHNSEQANAITIMRTMTVITQP